METIADITAQPVLRTDIRPYTELVDVVVTHEALHRFFGWHGNNAEADYGIMEFEEAIKTGGDIAPSPGQIMMMYSTKFPR